MKLGHQQQQLLSMAVYLFYLCIMLLAVSSVALPVQLSHMSNISTDDTAFSPAAGQEWGPDVSHYQGNINWADVKKVYNSYVSRIMNASIHSLLFRQALVLLSPRPLKALIM